MSTQITLSVQHVSPLGPKYHPEPRFPPRSECETCVEWLHFEPSQPSKGRDFLHKLSKTLSKVTGKDTELSDLQNEYRQLEHHFYLWSHQEMMTKIAHSCSGSSKREAENTRLEAKLKYEVKQRETKLRMEEIKDKVRAMGYE